MKRNYVDTSIGDVFDEADEARFKQPNKLLAFIGFLSLPVFAGLLVGLFMLPAFTPAVAFTDSVQDYWDELPSELPEIIPPQRSVILDKNGDKLSEFFVENRVLVELDTVSPNVIDALISTEDRKFYEHNGVDHKGVARALVSNTLSGTEQGASTITQQLVKNTLVLSATNAEERAAATEVSYKRKFEEMKYALELERSVSKDEILERYLNIALFSNGVYGIGTAADYYFSKPASDLTVDEAALLIGLLKNPSRYDPINNPQNAENRRDTVLSLMLDNEKLTQKEYEEAVELPLELDVNKPNNGCNVSSEPYYCQWVVNNIRSDEAFGKTSEDRENLIYWGGLTIHTYFDPDMQKDLQKTVDNALGRDNRAGTAIATVVPGTGAVPAFAQNRSWGADGENDKGEKQTQVIYSDRASFQPGSSFKVFTLLTALESGFSPRTVLNAPASYKNPNMNTPPGGITNISQSGTGRMDAYTATARSSNTWFAVLQEKLGVLKVAEMAENLGINVPREGGRAVTSQDASFTLGTISVSPIQMAAAYATIANNGVYCEPHAVESIIGPTGEEIFSEDTYDRCRRAFSVETATTATSILRGVVESDDPNRTANNITMNRPVAGKTGTANRATEVWFVGYTPQYSTAVWVGDPRGAQKYPLGNGFRYYGQWIGSLNQVYGSAIAAPIWKDGMDRISRGLPVKNFTAPLGDGIAGVVPDVRGLGVSEAVSTLKSHGYQVVIASENSDKISEVGKNVVVEQTPEPSSKSITQMEEIVLTLSKGSDKFKLDDAPDDVEVSEESE